jgi:hypothetical protein
MIKYINVITPFPIDPAKVLTYSTNSDIDTRFSRGLLIAVIMEAVRTYDTSVCFDYTVLYPGRLLCFSDLLQCDCT